MGKSFYLTALRLPFGQFKIETSLINKTNFHTLNFLPDYKYLTNGQCLTAKFNSKFSQLDLFVTDCFEMHMVICRKILFAKPDCSNSPLLKNQKNYAILLNPALRLHYKQAIEYKKAEMEDMMLRLNMTEAYESVFSTLWYSSHSCFGLNSSLHVPMLKYCELKGVPIPCSDIFQKKRELIRECAAPLTRKQQKKFTRRQFFETC
jgi:hypothetical protein